MAFRTTPELVKGIVKVKAGVDLTPFIETANMQVTDICSSAGYADARMEMIERWLSAHYYSTYKPRTTGESIKGLSQQFEGTTKVGLSNTRYGQQAMILDYRGLLKFVDTRGVKIKGSVTYIGGPSRRCDNGLD